MVMKLSAPKKNTFWIAIALAIVGLIFLFLPFVGAFAFWILLIGFIILMLGSLIKGM
jgi:hypothetical protein